MIEINNITKRYGKLTALDNVSVHFHKSECIALIGPNGCGKTTLIKSVLGIVLPESGEIKFQNEIIKGEFLYRRKIGYMPQIGRYPENMSIGQIIDMITEIRNPDSKPDHELIDAFKLKDIFSKKMNTLSGGTTQKVSAALSFLFAPEVLILDEPTAGLDPIASEILKDKIIKEKQKGKLILITSHVLSELDDLISSIVFMQDGHIKFRYSVDELQKISNEHKISKAISTILKNQ